jgi:uncharacterized protein YjbJ (UPF0337 family)
MSKDDKSGEAAKALFDSVKGKAKEAFGAVTGNDSLTSEGQLNQVDAKERRDAAKAEAEADAEAKEAMAAREDAKREANQQRLEAGAEAQVATAQVRGDQAVAKAAADDAARQDALREQTKAEADAQHQAMSAKADERADIRAAADEYAEAVDDHRHELNEAVQKEAEANQLRLRAEVMDANDRSSE